ncbi:hypothetical protein [Effusibacillus pohliae]|uniref:hypothetical protein n=1 Tax=Effusibacillus pohliae TaxID=232270 RepID=UPI00037ACF37|nr:hypothetical protein [Effusibacillus pohliae]
MPLQDLYLLRARYTREQGLLGNVPLLASTVPLIFMVFGNHLAYFLPSHNSWWLLVMGISVVSIAWSLTHHFRVKGNTACMIYLIDQAIRQRESTDRRR